MNILSTILLVGVFLLLLANLMTRVQNRSLERENEDLRLMIYEALQHNRPSRNPLLMFVIITLVACLTYIILNNY